LVTKQFALFSSLVECRDEGLWELFWQAEFFLRDMIVEDSASQYYYVVGSSQCRVAVVRLLLVGGELQFIQGSTPFWHFVADINTYHAHSYKLGLVCHPTEGPTPQFRSSRRCTMVEFLCLFTMHRFSDALLKKYLKLALGHPVTSDMDCLDVAKAVFAVAGFPLQGREFELMTKRLQDSIARKSKPSAGVSGVGILEFISQLTNIQLMVCGTSASNCCIPINTSSWNPRAMGSQTARLNFDTRLPVNRGP